MTRQVLAREGGRFGRFVIVGLAATLVHFLVLSALVELTSGIGPTVATLIGSAFGILTSYLGNYRYVYRVQQGRHISLFGSFLVAYALVFLIHGGLMAWMSGRLGWHYGVVFVLATGFSTVATFLANRLWVFRRHAVPHNQMDKSA